MVSYTEWTEAVHEAYKAAGGTYPSGNSVVQALTRAAADFWNRNKDELLDLALDAVTTVARELVNELLGGSLSSQYDVAL